MRRMGFLTGNQMKARFQHRGFSQHAEEEGAWGGRAPVAKWGDVLNRFPAGAPGDSSGFHRIWWGERTREPGCSGKASTISKSCMGTTICRDSGFGVPRLRGPDRVNAERQTARPWGERLARTLAPPASAGERRRAVSVRACQGCALGLLLATVNRTRIL
jgi:hypothetical protein